MQMKAVNFQNKTTRTSKMPWKLGGEEAKHERERIIKYTTEKLHLSSEDGKTFADIWINAVNSTEEELGDLKEIEQLKKS